MTESLGRYSATLGSWHGILRHFFGVVGGFWWSPQGRSAWAFAAGLLALNGAEVLLLLRVNTWNRDLFDALERRDGLQVLVDSGTMLLLLVAGFAVTSYLNLHARRRLAVGWRTWLAERLTAEWLAIGGKAATEHANIDGRIAEDARIATEEAVELACSFSHALITLACFVGVLWTLSAHPPIVLGWPPSIFQATYYGWRCSMPGSEWQWPAYSPARWSAPPITAKQQRRTTAPPWCW